MNRSLPAVALALLTIPVAACSAHWDSDRDDGRPGIAASGSGSQRHWAVSGFDAVNVAAAGDVQVRVGPGFSLVGTGSPDLLDKVKITHDGHTLTIGRRRGVDWRGGKVQFVLTMPRIAGAGIGGSGSIAIDHVDGPAFEGDIGGSGRLDVRGMRVGKAKFSIGGSGDVSAAGSAQALAVSIGGSGSVRATPLSAQTASISIAGAGNVAATVARTADVTIMGSGDVTVAGGAKCSVTKMGAGTVHCG